MNSYKKSAAVIQCLSVVIMLFSTFLTLAHWFFPLVYKAIYNATGIRLEREFDSGLVYSSFSWFQKVSGFLVEGVALGLLLIGMWLVIQLMNYIGNKEYFSLRVISLLKRITKIALVYVIYTPICASLLSIIGSLHNKPGERIIAIGFGSTDVYNIMFFCFMLLMMTIFQKGYELEHEQKLTI